MEFELTIRIGNTKHTVQDNASLVRALHAAAERIERTGYSVTYPLTRGIVIDINGEPNSVGEWSIKHSAGE